MWAGLVTSAEKQKTDPALTAGRMIITRRKRAGVKWRVNRAEETDHEQKKRSSQMLIFYLFIGIQVVLFGGLILWAIIERRRKKYYYLTAKMVGGLEFRKVMGLL